MQQRDEVCFMAIHSDTDRSKTTIGAKRIDGKEEFILTYKEHNTKNNSDLIRAWDDLGDFICSFKRVRFVIESDREKRYIHRDLYLATAFGLANNHVSIRHLAIRFFKDGDNDVFLKILSSDFGELYEIITNDIFLPNNAYSIANYISQITEEMYGKAKREQPDKIKSISDFFQEFWKS